MEVKHIPKKSAELLSRLIKDKEGKDAFTIEDYCKDNRLFFRKYEPLKIVSEYKNEEGMRYLVRDEPMDVRHIYLCPEGMCKLEDGVVSALIRNEHLTYVVVRDGKGNYSFGYYDFREWKGGKTPHLNVLGDIPATGAHTVKVVGIRGELYLFIVHGGSLNMVSVKEDMENSNVAFGKVHSEEGVFELIAYNDDENPTLIFYEDSKRETIKGIELVEIVG